jgi:predicted aldo/keto reductase-like oxidoreductase
MIQDENGNRVVDQDVVNTLIDHAIQNGINYFDAAPPYLAGLCEAATGIALKRHKREDFFIATKMSNYRDFSFEAAKAMYEKSFADLQVDYIDYYLLHGVGGGEGIKTFNDRFIDNGVLDFLLEEKKAGRIRNLGWSFHGDVAVFDHMFDLGIQWDFAMIQMNYIDWRHASGRNVNAEYLYHKCVENNTPVVIMEPLLGGRLGGLSPLARKVLDEINPNSTPAEWAFRYAGSFEHVLTTLSGMNKMEHLEENIKTHSPLKPLSKDEFAALEIVTEIMTTAGFINCTGCDYCVPCPFGVDIPGILLKYNTYISERKEIDKNDPILQQAGSCKGKDCGLCEKECPQRIGIVRQLAKIDSIVKAK